MKTTRRKSVAIVVAFFVGGAACACLAQKAPEASDAPKEAPKHMTAKQKALTAKIVQAQKKRREEGLMNAQKWQGSEFMPRAKARRGYLDEHGNAEAPPKESEADVVRQQKIADYLSALDLDPKERRAVFSTIEAMPNLHLVRWSGTVQQAIENKDGTVTIKLRVWPEVGGRGGFSTVVGESRETWLLDKKGNLTLKAAEAWPPGGPRGVVTQ